MERDPETYNVRAVERAMRILSSFDGEHPDRGVSEIAQATGLHKATAHRIMMTLLSGGFLERTPDGERFQLGLRVVELGLGALRGLDFRRAAFPYMQQLVERFQESCDLGIFDQGQVLYIEVVLSDQALTIISRVGGHLPAHCTATGKALLAFLPADIVEPVLSGPLEACTDKTITSPARLQEELEAIRQRGYAVDDEELSAGIRAIAVPIRDIDLNVVAAIGMPGPVSRMTHERVPVVAEAMMEAADVISAQVVRV
ncbi:MAG: IclR family transcriptional regulator [Anaerolineae bacterium]|nr:IclR family transcriptional regulator [Anaerolineae bacterium]